MISDLFEQDIKVISNKKRLRSKQLNRLIDRFELIFKKQTINFSFTLILAFFKEKKMTLEESWKNLNNVINEIYNFINKENKLKGLFFCFYSIEAHRNKESLKKENNVLNIKEIKNTLNNYPHIHIYCSYILDNSSELEYYINDITTNISEYFKYFDIQLNYISKEGHNIKNSLKYIIKEYRLLDVDLCIKNLDLKIKKLNVYTINNEKIISLIKEMTEIMNYNINYNLLKINYNIDEVINDPIFKLEKLLISSLEKDGFSLIGNQLYFKVGTNTWHPHVNLNQYFDNIIINTSVNKSLIYNNKKKLIDIYQTTKYRYPKHFGLTLDFIEFDDFIFDLVELKSFNLKTKNIKCFRKFCISKKELIDLNKNAFFYLERLFKSEEQFFNYLKTFSIILKNCTSHKGSALYVYGEPDTGKSLITEKYLLNLYGEHNLGILNTLDTKFMLDQIKDKHIIILNEFNFKDKDKTILLKLLDSTFVEFNKKYYSSEKLKIKSHTVANTNKSPVDQKFDQALLTRFNFYELIGYVGKNEYMIIKRLLPLFILYSSFADLCLNYKQLKRLIIDFLNNTYISVNVSLNKNKLLNND